MITKSISTKGHGCKSGRCAAKAVELTPGGLRRVSETGLREPKGTLTAMQESAEGIVDEREPIEGLNGMVVCVKDFDTTRVRI